MKTKVGSSLMLFALFCSCSLESANVIGPASGSVFYDKGNYSDGWRYLESSPIDAGTVEKDYLKGECTGGSASIGKGKQNTDLILAMHITDNDDGAGRAAQLCSEFYYGGYNDWFLPSKEELTQMIKTAPTRFSRDKYLTSTYDRTYGERTFFIYVKAEDALIPGSAKDKYKIRPIRRF